jgi:mono/diheme cytochrome c family protein
LRRLVAGVRIGSMRTRIALLALLGAFALPAAGCGGDDNPSTAEPSPATTQTTAGQAGDAANGKLVFESAGCGGCHTFAAAGSSGSVGPNLDDAAPSYDAVITQVTNGGGAMPSFGNDLTAQEIRDVAAFVSGS